MAIALNLHWITFRLHIMYVFGKILVSDSKILSSLTFNLFTKGVPDNLPILQQSHQNKIYYSIHKNISWFFNLPKDNRHGLSLYYYPYDG